MTSLAGTILGSFTAGVILLFIAGFFMKKDAVSENASSVGIATGGDAGLNEQAAAIEHRVLQSIDDADEMLLQLNSISGNILNEMESKYKELLFLYQMMEDKKEDLLNLSVKAEEKPRVLVEDQGLDPVDINKKRDLNTTNTESNETLKQPGFEEDRIMVEQQNEENGTISIAHLPQNVREQYGGIIEMILQGIDAVEIGKITGRGVGEIQFINGLIKGGQSNG